MDSLEQLETISATSHSRTTVCQSIPIFKKYILLKHLKNDIKRSMFLALFLYPYPVSITTIDFSSVVVGVDDDIPKKFILSCFQEFIHPLIQEDYVCFYTDGSKFEENNYTGTDIYSPSLHLKFMHRLPANASIFTAEA